MSLPSHLPASEFETALRMAQAFALRYPLRWWMQDQKPDLVSVAWVAVCEAVLAWEPGRGVRFSTYAVGCARYKMGHYTRDQYPFGRRHYEETHGIEVQCHKSLTDRIKSDSLLTVADQFPDDREWYGEPEAALAAYQLIDALPDVIQRQVITSKYLEGHSQTEIGRRLGVSQMQVSRIEKKAFAQLRELSEEPQITHAPKGTP